MSELSTGELDSLEALEKAATPKPWYAAQDVLGTDLFFPASDSNGEFPIDEGGGCFDESNATFIAALRNAAPSMIASARALAAAQERIAALEAEMVGYLVLWATRYAEMQMLGGLHPQHFDRLKELGARMDDFKRADIPSARLLQPKATAHD